MRRLHLGSYMTRSLSMETNTLMLFLLSWDTLITAILKKKKHLSRLYQFVTFPTRENKTLNQCYSNIRNAFVAKPKPHFGKSDHLAIWLKPTTQRT